MCQACLLGMQAPKFLRMHNRKRTHRAFFSGSTNCYPAHSQSLPPLLRRRALLPPFLPCVYQKGGNAALSSPTHKRRQQPDRPPYHPPTHSRRSYPRAPQPGQHRSQPPRRAVAPPLLRAARSSLSASSCPGMPTHASRRGGHRA